MKKVGKYEIRGLLGKGGMGVVYKVRMPVVGKLVALKLLSPHPNLVTLLGEAEIRRRFVSEAVTMARLRHPNLVAIWDFHDAKDLTFFVMEYFCKSLGGVIGETYRVETASRMLSVEKAIDYTGQVLAGLVRLHDAGIVHRDIKPYNVLITEQDTAKITDFGLSALHGETFGGPSNLMVGSPYYAAPEQEDDPDSVDCRADLYPVGVMLFRMLSGVLPNGGVHRLSKHHPDLDERWDKFLAKAVAHDREDRFGTAKEMLAALKELKVSWERKKERICRFQEETPAVSANGQSPTVRLRQEPTKVRPKQGRERFGLDEKWRPLRYIQNDLHEQGTDRVRDSRTGLMWQRSGSDYPLTWHEAHDYIAALNETFARVGEKWRLPTIEEIMSLLTDIPRGGDLCTEPIFSSTQRWLWSCDRQSFVAAWYANVELGYVTWQDFSCYYYVRGVSSDSTS
jgi:serine/threonine-protein kinase